MRGLRIAPFLALGVLIGLGGTSAEAQPREPMVDVGRLAQGESGRAWIEDRWEARFDLGEVEIRIPNGDEQMDRLDHTLRVAVLTDEGVWRVATEIPIRAEAVPRQAESPLADDGEALAFIERVDLTLAQFEYLVEMGMGEGILFQIERRGIPPDEVPASIRRRIAGEDVLPADDGDPAAASAWSLEIGWLIYRAPLPEPVLAEGVRFELDGPALMGGAWRLTLRTAGVPDEYGWMRWEWTYTHVW